MDDTKIERICTEFLGWKRKDCGNSKEPNFLWIDNDGKGGGGISCCRFNPFKNICHLKYILDEFKKRRLDIRLDYESEINKWKCHVYTDYEFATSKYVDTMEEAVCQACLDYMDAKKMDKDEFKNQLIKLSINHSCIDVAKKLIDVLFDDKLIPSGILRSKDDDSIIIYFSNSNKRYADIEIFSPNEILAIVSGSCETWYINLNDMKQTIDKIKNHMTEDEFDDRN